MRTFCHKNVHSWGCFMLRQLTAMKIYFFRAHIEFCESSVQAGYRVCDGVPGVSGSPNVGLRNDRSSSPLTPRNTRTGPSRKHFPDPVSLHRLPVLRFCLQGTRAKDPSAHMCGVEGGRVIVHVRLCQQTKHERVVCVRLRGSRSFASGTWRCPWS